MKIINDIRSWFHSRVGILEKMTVTKEERLRLKHYFVFAALGIPTMVAYGVQNYLNVMINLSGKSLKNRLKAVGNFRVHVALEK